MQWRERAMVFGDQLQGPDGAYNNNDILPAPGTRFNYDKNGVFQSGYATRLRPEVYENWGGIDWGCADMPAFYRCRSGTLGCGGGD